METLLKPKNELDILDIIEDNSVVTKIKRNKDSKHKISMCGCPCEHFSSESKDVAVTAEWNID